MVAEKSRPLKEICKHQPGKYLARSAYENGPYKVYGSNSEMGHHREPLYLGPMIVLARIGANAGALRYSNEPAWINNNASALIPELAVDPRWLYYKLLTMSLEQYRAGTSQPFITLDALMSAPVDIPDRNTQVAIAGILGALDDKIELNRRMNSTLEAMARALFQSWFVDFDPVHAKAEGRQPVGMDAETAALFPDSFEDSALGPIPKGWQPATVKDIGDVVTGKTPSTVDPRNFGDDVSFITIPDMHNKIFATVTARKLSKFGAQAQPSKSLPVGTLCVSCIATPGLVVITTEIAQTNQQINAVVPNDRDDTFFWFWVLKNLGADIASHGSGGSVLSNLSKGGFESLQIMKPPKHMINKYSKTVEPIFEKIRTVALESERISVVRDTLLPKLLSGELRVGDVAA